MSRMLLLFAVGTAACAAAAVTAAFFLDTMHHSTNDCGSYQNYQYDIGCIHSDTSHKHTHKADYQCYDPSQRALPDDQCQRPFFAQFTLYGGNSRNAWGIQQ